jgi:hypothetical protein
LVGLFVIGAVGIPKAGAGSETIGNGGSDWGGWGILESNGSVGYAVGSYVGVRVGPLVGPIVGCIVRVPYLLGKNNVGLQIYTPFNLTQTIDVELHLNKQPLDVFEIHSGLKTFFETQ